MTAGHEYCIDEISVAEQAHVSFLAVALKIATESRLYQLSVTRFIGRRSHSVALAILRLRAVIVLVGNILPTRGLLNFLFLFFLAIHLDIAAATN